MNRYCKWGLSGVIACCIASCGSHEKAPSIQTASMQKYTVTSQLLHKTLHFTGTIQPLHESTVTSPMTAVVESMPFHYGQMVKKRAIVFTLHSNELQKQYNDTLTEYLKAKDNYTIAKSKFLGTEDLWHAGLLSKNNYLSEKSSLNSARVTLIQDTRKLTELLEKIDETSTHNLSALSLSNFDKLRDILTSNHNTIHLKAPSNGVLLYPPKNGEDKSSRVTVGASVKPGQVLALVGDLSGVSVEIDVPEIDIDKIHTDMPATISGIAFGNHELQGKLVAVNAQASNSNNAGLPSFTAVVEVAKLTPEQQLWIKVGMSAAIEIHVDSKNQLVIPITAIKREHGQNVVTVQVTQKNTLEKRIVTTGAVQGESVVIESGLKAGDVVVYE